jgi:hypothetical protein
MPLDFKLFPDGNRFSDVFKGGSPYIYFSGNKTVN